MPDNLPTRGPSVLIVEDDWTTRVLLTSLLSQLGYESVPVASEVESTALLDGQQCAILDLSLPDGLGALVLERIRKEKRSIRVAVTTSGELDEAEVRQAQQLQAELVLRKPINVNELIAWLNRAR